MLEEIINAYILTGLTWGIVIAYYVDRIPKGFINSSYSVITLLTNIFVWPFALYSWCTLGVRKAAIEEVLWASYQSCYPLLLETYEECVKEISPDCASSEDIETFRKRLLNLQGSDDPLHIMIVFMTVNFFASEVKHQRADHLQCIINMIQRDTFQKILKKQKTPQETKRKS